MFKNNKPITRRRKVFLILLMFGLAIFSLLIINSLMNLNKESSDETSVDSINLEEISANYKEKNMTVEFKGKVSKDKEGKEDEEEIVGKVKLKSHFTYNEVRRVSTGDDRVLVWYELSDFKQVHKKSIGEVEFIDLRENIMDKDYVEEVGIENIDNAKAIIPNPDYLKPIKKDYEIVYLKDGEWLSYNSKDVPKENITIGIKADIGWGEHLDVVPTFFDTKLKRHAVVLGTSAGFLTTRPTADPAGSATDYSGNVGATRHTTPGGIDTVTEIGFWADGTAPGFNAQTVGVAIYEVGGGDSAGALVSNDTFAVDASEDVWKWTAVNIPISSATKYFIAVSFTDTAGVNYGANVEANTGAWKNGIFEDPFNPGGYYQFPFAIYAIVNTTGVSAKTMNVTLLSPSNNEQVINTTVFFNATIRPVNLNITNTTLQVWNSSNDLIISNTTDWDTKNNITVNWTETGFNLGEDYHWNVRTGGNDSNYTVAPNNYTFTASALTETATDYNSSILETSKQRFSQQISAIGTVTSASVYFWYNGTSHTTIVQDLGGAVYNVTNEIDIPLAKVSGNKTFYWGWTFTTLTQTIHQNSSIFSHEVNKTSLVACEIGEHNQSVNFTIHNATNPYPFINATFKIAMKHWLGGGTTKRNYSFEDVTETNFTFDFCASDNRTFNTDATIEYDGSGSALNFYYINNASFSNNSQNIKLYLLDDGKSTLTELLTVDEAKNPVENITIQIQAYDIGTDTFYTVSMGKTSTGGADLAYLNWYDTLYKFIFTQGGAVVKTTSPYKISATPQTFDIVSGTTFTFAKFEDMDYLLYYNSTTKNFVYTFVKPSGEVRSSCLRVIKRNITEDTQICITCESSASATLYCNVATSGNGTFIASIYATGSMQWLDTLVQTIGEIQGEIYDALGNIDGTVIAIIFAGVVLTFFLISPVVGIIGMLIGMLGAVALGFQPVDYASFVGIVFVGGLVIWLIQK